MYRVVLEVKKAGALEHVNLFENNDFSKCLEYTWGLIREKGIPASQLDILRKNGKLFYSVWAEYLDWKGVPA